MSFELRTSFRYSSSLQQHTIGHHTFTLIKHERSEVPLTGPTASTRSRELQAAGYVQGSRLFYAAYLLRRLPTVPPNHSFLQYNITLVTLATHQHATIYVGVVCQWASRSRSESDAGSNASLGTTRSGSGTVHENELATSDGKRAQCLAIFLGLFSAG